MDKYAQRIPLHSRTVLFSRYQIQHLIGQGGFGLTYVAFDLQKSKKVAIKEHFPYGNSYREISTQKIIFHKAMEEKKFNKYIFAENEATILKKISSIPEVIAFEDYFLENNTAYIVTEYFKGITLQEWVQKQGKISERECLKLLEPIIACLSKLHMMGIVHRDVCPENILVSEDRKLKLIDFGSALDLNQENSKEILEPTYRKGFSPSQQCDKSYICAAWRDLYAIEATIRYCITKKVPV